MLKNHTAGSPVNGTIKWTNLKRGEISERLKEHGFPVSVTAVDQLSEKHKFRSRKAFKVEVGKKNIPDRDELFNNTERLEEEYRARRNPVISMDVKKELIGNFYRPGKPLATEPVTVNDHDFPAPGTGKSVPRGLYSDFSLNKYQLQIGSKLIIGDSQVRY